MTGLKILGLASDGGQQGPILTTFGADVTLFDNLEKQLQQDKTLSDKFDLDIKTVQGDMKDLSVFIGNSFDLIFNPCSMTLCWQCFTSLERMFLGFETKGILMTGLICPILQA